LKPGENKKVEITLTKDALAYYRSDTNDWAVDPGKYEIMIGSSSREIKLKKSISIR